jgi:hypothetical protein
LWSHKLRQAGCSGGRGKSAVLWYAQCHKQKRLGQCQDGEKGDSVAGLIARRDSDARGIASGEKRSGSTRYEERHPGLAKYPDGLFVLSRRGVPELAFRAGRSRFVTGSACRRVGYRRRRFEASAKRIAQGCGNNSLR